MYKNWTLFLDRDGVINDEIPDSYVLSWDMFRFSNGVLEALPLLAQHFGRIVMVTNQRCIGRGLLTVNELETIHQKMLDQVAQHGGRIDKIYFCPDVDNSSPCRKPQSGMAMAAKHDFPDIDFTRSVMVGNTLSDMEFGKQLGMTTVFIPSTKPQLAFPHPLMDARFNDLWLFSQAIQ
ncbi:HAD-IIIA family hydrolase [Chitinophaga agrisoli]|uniref:D,D-heptose 1,7-bisphosphate phosphatase n=1 Tax=Chitinophaga agrisoli TaxID=2607653 RepID=A0A5B2VXP3_9BACT|nr:HAD-IIIA family hydrolase [Chitinophaga agrisoli]KAA2243017.1 HAD-IIIA family hydrolase [Chitinophaga agrisoli]